MMKKAVIAIVTVVMLLSIADVASAETFTIELPELVGLFDVNSSPKTASFDFGTSFLSIDEVRIQASGTFTLGSVHGDGVNDPVDEWWDVYPIISIYMDLEPGFASEGLCPWESPFNIEEPLWLFLGATWDSLLDGTGEVEASWSHSYVFEEGVFVTLPTVQVSEAHLTIVGVVPEPATVLLLAMGTICARAGRRKKSRQLKHK